MQILLGIVFVLSALALARSPWQASLTATVAFGVYLLITLLLQPGVFLAPDMFIVTIILAVVLYLAVAAAKKIRRANAHSV